MIEVVINYSKEDKQFKIYEPTTDTLLVSTSLTEALVNLSNFLVQAGLAHNDILSNPDISYHLDSYTLKEMVESNVNLIKRLQTAPSGFMISSQKFGGSTISKQKKEKKSNNGFDHTGFDKAYKSEVKSKHFSNSSRSASFSGKSGFRTANKKFGNN